MTESGVSVIVIDNDPKKSAESTVAELQHAIKWPVYYECEPRRGIPYARNAAIKLVLDNDFDYLVFIDDDELPRSDWLRNLITVRTREEAPIVTGPVEAILPEGAPMWISKGGFFPRKNLPTGTELPGAATGNVLVDAEVFRSTNTWFDGELALSGGSDSEFFRRMKRCGFKIAWCDEAVVFEQVSVERATWRWLTRRWYRRGNARALRDFRRRGVLFFIAGLSRVPWRVLCGTGHMATACIRGRHELIAGWLLLAESAGILMGLLGHKFKEYTTTTGS